MESAVALLLRTRYRNAGRHSPRAEDGTTHCRRPKHNDPTAFEQLPCQLRQTCIGAFRPFQAGRGRCAMKCLFMLIALTLICSGAARAQTGTNCSYGSYQLAGATQNTPPCSNPPPTITYSATYNESCTTSYGAQTPGQVYWTATSTVSGTVQNYCFGFSSTSCPPVMQFQETDGSNSTDYNCFYNRAYNYVVAGSSCSQSSMNQEFKQCQAQTCVTR